MHVVWVCHYFVPEIGAPSARLYDLSKEWIARGHSVTVITGFPNHPTGIIPTEYRGKLWQTEFIDGIRVLRCPLYVTPNEGFVKKSLGHLSFMVTAVLLGMPRLGQADVLIASSPTFFAVISAFVIGLLKRIPFIFEVRDLWPAVFVDLGIIKNRALIGALEAVEWFLYQRAAKVVTVTESFAETLIKRGLPKEKAVTITNGADMVFFQPAGKEEARRKKEESGLLLPSSSFLILYLGAHGISHGLESVLRAADRLREFRDIEFVFVGEGAEKKKLIALKDELALENVTFLPGQPKAKVPEFYHAADVGLVPLRDVPLFAEFIPSKMFELMACGVPIVGAVRGEPARILERSGAALLVPPEDPAALAEAIVTLRDDPARRRRMGEAGRKFVEENYDRRSLAERYERALSSASNGA